MEDYLPTLHEQLTLSDSVEVKALIAQDKVGWHCPEGSIQPRGGIALAWHFPPRDPDNPEVTPTKPGTAT